MEDQAFYSKPLPFPARPLLRLPLRFHFGGITSTDFDFSRCQDSLARGFLRVTGRTLRAVIF
jgi:hypothetical protein